MTCAICGEEVSDPAAECPVCGAPTVPDGPAAAALEEDEDAGFFSPGSVVAGRYRLGRLLGRGGMGRVFRADDLRLGQPVALKFLTADWDPVLRQRFLDEVRFARQVSHANVCRVYDVGETGSRLFLSMELVAGEDLRTLLARGGPLPPERAAEVSVQICRGLGAIHERGLLHRDLKPANVMIDESGQARLTDFGLAAPAAAGAATPGGTPAYLAPEQLVGEPATMRSDLYALGLVIYELHTGRRAYPKHALLALSRRYRGDAAAVVPAADLGLETAALDPAVAAVVRWCLATGPWERPASAEAVSAALRPDADAGQVPGTFLRTLVVSDPAGGDSSPLLAEHGGREAGGAAGPVWLFERPWSAVCFALAWRRSPVFGAGAARLGIHLGEVDLQREEEGPLRAGGPEVDRVRSLAAMARPGQTLLSAHAFALARHRSVGEAAPQAAVRWLAHGRYRLAGVAEPMEVFEVGVEGAAPFLAPESAAGVQAVSEDLLPGWRPAPGAAIPQRPGWRIERKLGEGGFGDVWLAREGRSQEPRVFKFCYDRVRLRGLQREITIFRLLKEHLGERPDITRVLDWSFDEAPYFIESDYTAGGSLPEWADGQGGLARVPLAARLEIVAQVATALAAAHSVGVLHKDVKPGNVLIAAGDGGEVKAQLSDFGIGAVTDRSRLAAAGITALGLTGMTAAAEPGSGSTAGGTRLYLAPELLEGKPPTLQTDVYALGIVLYQIVVGDLSRALAPGWRRGIADDVLCADIAAAVDGSPEKRLGNAAELAERLRTLEARRAAREAGLRARQRAERAQRQRRALAVALAALAVFALAVSGMAWRIAREAERAEREAKAAQQVADFLVGMFEVNDPFAVDPMPGTGGPLTARDVLDRGARRLATELRGQPEIRARLMNTVGRVYERLGHYDPAKALFEEALALRRKSPGEAGSGVAESLQDLGWLLHLQGDQKRAEALLREALALRRQSLGEEHPYVADSLTDLAWVLQADGDYAAAEKVSRQALAMKRRLLKGPHHSLAASLDQLAFILYQQGNYAGAEPFAREALAVNQALGSDHPDVAESLNGLARILQWKGDYEGTERLYRQALALQRRRLGDHPATALSLHDLAWALYLQRKYDAAEALYRESLALFRRLLGAENPSVAMNLNNLALVLHAKGDDAGAEALSRESAAMRRRLLGARDPFVAHSLNNLAIFLVAEGRAGEAETTIREALDIFRRSLPAGHWQICEAESVLGSALAAQGRYAEAEPLLVRCDPVLARRTGARSPFTRASRERLAALYEAWGKPGKAAGHRARLPLRAARR